MFRVTIGAGTNTINHLSPSEWVGVTSTFSQIIRWKKKPLWLPPAKSKLFRISQRYRPPPEEFVEIKRLYDNYRTYCKSLKAYFMKVVAENKVLFDEEVMRKAEDDDYNRCMIINHEWNNQVKLIRDQRLAEEKVQKQREIIEKLTAAEIQKQELAQKIANKVRKAKEESVTFITPENIDRAIEEALANVVNYNVAIDTQGKEYTDINKGVEQQARQSI